MSDHTIVIILVMKIFFGQDYMTLKIFCTDEETKNKNELNDPDNHDGVITPLKPDILECEVKWALGSITMNKSSGGDGILVELF